MKRNFDLAAIVLTLLALTGNVIVARSAFAQAKKQLEDCAKRSGTC